MLRLSEDLTQKDMFKMHGLDMKPGCDDILSKND